MKASLKVLFGIIRTITKKHTGTHASSIAFFFFMALVPLIIIYACLIPKGAAGPQEITGFLQGLVPAELGGLIETVVTEAFSKSQIAFSVSLLFLLWTASRGIRSLIDGLNAMYDETEKRGFAKITGLSVVYTAALVLFLSAVVFLIFSGRLRRILGIGIPHSAIPREYTVLANFLVMFFTGILFFETLYTFLPAGSRKFRDQFPGAFLASSGWFILSIAFRIYVSCFNGITRLYGSLATVSLFLFWLYCVFYILLAGGAVNSDFDHLVPAGIVILFRKEKKERVIIWVLFLIGFISYLSDCFLTWNTRPGLYLPLMQTVFSLITQGCWIMSTACCVRGLHGTCPAKKVRLLLLLAAVDLFLLRPSFFRNVILYLVIYTLFCLSELLLCLRIVLKEADRSLLNR